MWTSKASKTTSASREKIWQLWTDVSNWNKYDKGTKSSELLGEFKVGTKGSLQPTDGPKSEFEITECTPLKSFSNVCMLPFCKMEFTHNMEDTAQGLQVTHQVSMSGPLTFIFSRVIGSQLAKGLPDEVENITKMAQNLS
jgi:hypothetical protein